MAKAAAARKRKMMIEMSGRKKCLCDVGDLGRTRRKHHRRRTLRDVGSLGMETMRRGCKNIRTRYGGIVRGCYNSRGQFRFRKS